MMEPSVALPFAITVAYATMAVAIVTFWFLFGE